MVKLKHLLNEVLSEADVFGSAPKVGIDKVEDELEREMGKSLKDLETEFKKDGAKVAKDVDQVDEAMGATAIIGLILAAPKLVELIAKGFDRAIKGFKKLLGKQTSKEPSKIAATIIDATHKWHKAYIKILQFGLKLTGVFRKANITDEKEQFEKAEFLYYVIIAGMAIASGVGAVKAFEQGMTAAAHGGGFKLAALETAMTAVKSGEAAAFVRKLGLGA